MKLIFAVLDVSLTMGLTRCYKTEGFFTFILITLANFYYQSGSNFLVCLGCIVCFLLLLLLLLLLLFRPHDVCR